MSEELNIRVAKALGWTPRTVSEYPFGDGTFVVYDGPNGECLIPGGCNWKFSEEWDKAAHVVQVLRCGYRGHVAAVIKMTVLDCLGPDCEVEIYGPDIARVHAHAQEMPEAICLAFLKVADRDAEREEAP